MDNEQPQQAQAARHDQPDPSEPERDEEPRAADEGNVAAAIASEPQGNRPRSGANWTQLLQKLDQRSAAANLGRTTLARARAVAHRLIHEGLSAAEENAPDARLELTRRLRLLGQQLAQHPVAAGIVGIVAFISGLITILNFMGVSNVSVFRQPVQAYLDGWQHAVMFLGWVGLAVLAGIVALCLGLALRVWHTHVVVSRALTVTIIAVVLALPFASPLLTSDCGTLICPAAAPPGQQVLHQGLGGQNTAFKLDPARSDTGDEYEIVQVLFPALVQFDAHLQVMPWAASSYGVSSDGKTYTFTLHSGLQWSDGTPIHTDDFAFALNRSLDPCTAAPTASYLYPIQDALQFHGQPCTDGKPNGALQTLIGHSLLVRSPQTLTIKLEQPAAYFLDALTTPIASAVPRPLVQTYGTEWTDHLTDGAGWGGDLFKLTTLDRALDPKTHVELTSHLVLTRNEQFWGTKPKLRAIDFTFYADDAAAYRDYVAGKGDVSTVSTDDLASARLRGTELRSTGTLAIVHFGVNWATAPFDDVRMRQAFALALDKGKLVTDSRSDLAIPTNHIVPEGMPGYNPNLSGPKNSGLHGNAQLAQALAQAYANDKCGGSLSACPPVALGVSSVYSSAYSMATESQQMWQQALPHYPITQQKVADSYTMFNMVRGKQLQLYYATWGADYPDPRDFLSVLCLPGSEWNFGQISLQEATSLLQRADGETDPGVRLSDYEQAEQLLVDDAALIPLHQYKNFYVVRPFVIGFSITAELEPSSDTWQRVYIAQH